jgi:hypothetical protein
MRMEHRWGPRQATDVAVRFVARPGTMETGRVRNISMTGAYMETRVPLRRFSLVYLEPVTPTSGAARRIAASVVRQDALGVGLEWCELAAEAAPVAARLALLMGSGVAENDPPAARTAEPLTHALASPGNA